MFTKEFVLLLAVLAYPSSGHILKPDPNRTNYDPRDFLNTRIVGGIEAPPGYGEHTVALVHGEIMTFLMCGGSIISTKHILTAAHCIDPLVIWGQLMPSARVVVGSNKWASTDNNIGFTGYINHPQWNWSTIKNDIGILFLAHEIQIRRNVAIIPLQLEWAGSDVQSHVTGWGRLGSWQGIPDTLQMLKVSTIPPQQCIDGIKEAAYPWGSPPVDPNIEICTLHSVGHGMCNGDSGSALVNEKTGKQIGIVSWGMPCALGAPDVFVRISAYWNWVHDIIGNRSA